METINISDIKLRFYKPFVVLILTIVITPILLVIVNSTKTQFSWIEIQNIPVRMFISLIGIGFSLCWTVVAFALFLFNSILEFIIKKNYSDEDFIGIGLNLCVGAAFGAFFLHYYAYTSQM